MTCNYLKFTTSTHATGKMVGSGTSGDGLTNSSVKAVDIPSIYDGVNVVEICYKAFRGTSITSVFIPKTIQYIGNHAFENCYYLSDVRFESNSQLITIEKDIFQNDNNIIKIDLPASVQTILHSSGAYIFYDVKSLVCFSYLGSTDFSQNYLFANTPEIHVSNSKYPAGKNLGFKSVIRDDKTCIASNKCRYSIIVRYYYPDLSKFSILLLVS